MIVLVRVDATPCLPSIVDVVIIAFDPTHLLEELFIRNVGCKTRIPCIGRLDVDNGNISRPFFPHFEQQISGRCSIGEEDLDVVVNLFLKHQALTAKAASD